MSVIDDIIRAEGSTYTNRTADRGGPTRFGITLKTLSAARGTPCTAADVAALTEAEARAIYAKRYIVDPGFDKIVDISALVGNEVIDTGVNMGQTTAGKFLQRALNALNGGGQRLMLDGQCGTQTLAVLRAYLDKRGHDGERTLLVLLNCLQAERYVEIAEHDPTQLANMYGWIRQRVAAQVAA